MVIKILNTILTVVAGIGVVLVLYWILNKLVELLPGRWEDRLKPYVYILPAVAAIGLYVVYPGIQTIVYSFANAREHRSSSGSRTTEAVELQRVPADAAQPRWCGSSWRRSQRSCSGLLVATLVDKLRPSGEKIAKTIVFFPMAISAVSAGTVWQLVYAYAPPGQPQVGIQNAMVTALGFDPVAWLSIRTFYLNTLLLIVMFLWSQVGFSMVLLSAAIKGVPTETVEAGRVDGASERQIFRRIVFPQIMPTVVTVYITVLIGVMKLFDVVYVMTNGNFNTNVLAVEFFNQLFTNFNNGLAAAIVVLLMLAVVPVMIFQVRQFRLEEANR